MSMNLDKNRTAFLKLLYEKSHADESKVFEAEDLGKELGFNMDMSFKIANYLKGEGLLDYQGFGGTIRITHQGIKTMEELKSFWKRHGLNRFNRWLVVLIAAWVVDEVLNRGVPVLVNALSVGLTSVSVGNAPTWETRLVAFTISIPAMYVSFSQLFYNRIKKDKDRIPLRSYICRIQTSALQRNLTTLFLASLEGKHNPASNLTLCSFLHCERLDSSEYGHGHHISSTRC